MNKYNFRIEDHIKNYEDKRNFKSTSEPEGSAVNNKQSGKNKGLVFVVQKHYASRLHYDFRLELDGVLKSWAIPKGPTLDPANKHLAVLVEDHPFVYKDFSGIIPEGNYGAGRVEIWDTGTYLALDSPDSKDTAHKVRAGFNKGHITIILNGKKLNGEFAFIRLRKAKKNDWMLIKKNDQFAVRGWDIKIEDEESV
ncbi:MAG: DNA polymerase ligase N-terminal domain-containing protein [Candidatus Humimicrobiaceae bacterium]